MKNIFKLKERPGEEAPKEVYGWRPYALAFAASWVRLEFTRPRQIF